jgi:hypothetical protein
LFGKLIFNPARFPEAKSAAEPEHRRGAARSKLAARKRL